MKNVKVMLTALVVLVAVGGALAFKAKKFPVRFVYTENPLIPNWCDQGPIALTTTDDEEAIPTKLTYPVPNNCIVTFTTDQEQP